MNISVAKKYLLGAGIGAIAVAALMAIWSVLSGSFDEFQIKVLSTTLVLGYFCFMSFATFGEGRVYTVFAIIGLTLAALGLILTLPTIWFMAHDPPGKAILSIAILSFGTAHVATNYRLSVQATSSIIAMCLANAAVVMVTSIVVVLIMTGFENLNDGIMRLLLILVIVDVALTAINPIVSKVSRS